MGRTESPAAGTKVGRARLTPGQLWQVPTFLVGLLAFLGVAASAPLRSSPQAREFDALVSSLREGLEAGRDPDALVTSAEEVLVRLPRFERRAGEVHYLAGSAYLRQAERRPAAQGPELRAIALRHLERAVEAGLEGDDLPRLHYRLGRLLHETGKDPARALELMTRSADRGADQPLPAFQLLVRANLARTPPNLDGALAVSDKLLELSDGHADASAEVRLLRADLQMKKGQRADAIRELERVNPRASVEPRVRARLLQAKLCEEEEQWAKAGVVWHDLLADADRVPGGKAHVLYALGRACRQLEPPDEKGAVEAWSEAAALTGPEAQAAGLRVGELLLLGKKPDAGRALDCWQKALAEVTGPDGFKNPVMELAETRALFDRVLQGLQDAEDYATMEEAAALYRKLATPGVADQRLALAAEAHAKKLQDEKAEAATVRAAYRRAAEAYEQAARARPFDERGEPLWAGARCYLGAKESDRAARALEALDELLPGRDDERPAEGWYQLGEAYRADGKQDKARKAYLSSMQYATSPFAARSRYQLAVEEVKKRDWKKAEEILLQNLGADAARDRWAHEKSLYQLAWVVLERGDFGRAEVYLKQATGRYPNNPNAFIVRDQLGNCYHRLAQEALQKEQELADAVRAELGIENRQQLDENMRQHRQTRRKWLSESAGVYRALADDLAARQQEGKLTDVELRMLRRAVLGLADSQADLAEYRDALKSYQSLLTKHRGHVETLIACHRLFRLTGVVTDPELKGPLAAAARDAVRMAIDDLKDMDPKGSGFQGPQVWGWDHWQRELTAIDAALGQKGQGEGGQ